VSVVTVGPRFAMDRLDKNVVHEICTNQVVVTLQACVKELVENSLDAGATRIEVRVRESGAELLEIIDDGCGIASADYAKVATRHATSKIREYDDLSKSLNTFGFRGEALSAICAMGEVTVLTRHAQDAAAVALTYDRFGKLSGQTPAAREVGTTISVRDLFKRLPVRHREFMRNAKAQVSATLKLIQAYAVAQPQIRFHVIAEKARGHGAGRATLLCTSGSVRGWRNATAAVLGDQIVADTQLVEIQSETGISMTGLVSTPLGGRRSRDTQLYFVNNRPIDPPKRIAKLVNDTYHQYNSRMWPVVVLSFSAAQHLVDVNVTPDKKTVFLHNEESLMTELQKVLTKLYQGACGDALGGSLGPSAGSAALSSFGIKPAIKKEAGVDDDAVRTPESAAGAGCVGGGLVLASVAAATAALSGATAGEDIEFETPPRMPATPAGRALTKSQSNADSPKPAFPGALGGSKHADGIDLLVEEYVPETQASTDWGSATQEMLLEEFNPESSQGDEGPCVTELRFASDGGEENADVSMEPVAEATEGDGFQIVEIASSTKATSSTRATSSSAKPASSSTKAASSSAVPAKEYSEYLKLVNEAAGHPLGTASVSHDPTYHVKAQYRSHDFAMPPAEYVASPPVDISVSMAALSAAVDRRKRRRQMAPNHERAVSAPTVSFPSAFSLSSLRSGAGAQSGGSSSSRSTLDAVANFNVGGDVPGEGEEKVSPAPNDNAASAAAQDFRFDKSCFFKMRVIGQFNLGFVLAALRTQSPSTHGNPATDVGGLQLFIIDQHASDEKFRFEQMNRESKIDRQPLVSPHALQLTPAQEQLAVAHMEVFRMNGFALTYDEERQPGRRLKLTALPTCKGLVFGEKDVEDLLHTLEEAETDRSQPSEQDAAAGLLDLAGHRALWSNSTSVPRPKKVWQLLACRACRGAIMIGKALRPAEMEKILANLGSLEHPWNCPHGRPTMRHLVDAGAAWRTPTRPPPLLSQLP